MKGSFTYKEIRAVHVPSKAMWMVYFPNDPKSYSGSLSKAAIKRIVNRYLAR